MILPAPALKRMILPALDVQERIILPAPALNLDRYSLEKNDPSSSRSSGKNDPSGSGLETSEKNDPSGLETG